MGAGRAPGPGARSIKRLRTHVYRPIGGSWPTLPTADGFPQKNETSPERLFSPAHVSDTMSAAPVSDQIGGRAVLAVTFSRVEPI
jgi:hypothetical protein